MARQSRKTNRSISKPTVLELCAGGGGQSLGLELAGFQCVGAVEIDDDACATLKLNRPRLNVINGDLKEFDASGFSGTDFVTAGVPCPPFSIAGKQLGQRDERDLFPEALRIVREVQPKAAMFENVRGFASNKFSGYRDWLIRELRGEGYEAAWRLLNACDYGVPQLRPRFVLVALKSEYASFFSWPETQKVAKTVGETLIDLMAAGGWKWADNWAEKASAIAPTIVGGSKKHGGADLGPTRAKQQWKELGVNGLSLADAPPPKSFPKNELPRLTHRMVARIQSFPDEWEFSGRKTSSYRQVGNAFPPLVAKAVSQSVLNAINKRQSKVSRKTATELFPFHLIAGA